MFQRLLPILLLIAHVSLWAAAILTLGKLEGPYPTHFDLQGQPDAWSEAGWWLYPLLTAAISGVLIGAVWLGRRLARTSPEWVNMPRKRDWVALSVEARLRSFKAAEGLVFGFAVFLNLLCISLVLDTYGVATGVQPGLSVTKMVLVLVCMAVWLVLSLLRIRQAVGDEVRHARRTDGPDAA
jgi:hypothetical protein